MGISLANYNILRVTMPLFGKCRGVNMTSFFHIRQASKHLIRTGFVVGSLISFVPVAGAGGFGNDSQSCAAGQPCFTGYRQLGNKVVFRWNNGSGWNVFNVRYGNKQVENSSGTFSFTNVRPGRIYTISVQGCHSHTFGRSDCSPWSSQSVTTQ
jgi:hypothetical protein